MKTGSAAARVAAHETEQALVALGNAADAATSQRYFKTAPGDYGADDRFLGIRVPVLRRTARDYYGLDVDSLEILLHSQFHEVRSLALMLFIRKYERDATARVAVYDIYLANTKHINNWDLVDLSAPPIVGAHLESRDRSVLDKLAKSKSLWERRIAMLATFHFIRKGEFDDAFRIADLLIADKEDLIHKAVGWGLREVGNIDRGTEELYLKSRYTKMPRTMLRHAIEKFPPALRETYMRGTA